MKGTLNIKVDEDAGLEMNVDGKDKRDGCCTDENRS